MPQVMVPLSVVCLAPFMQAPVLQLGYTVGGGGELGGPAAAVASASLDLPVVATKFCQPVEVPRDVFITRWAQVRCLAGSNGAVVAEGSGAGRGGAVLFCTSSIRAAGQGR